MSGEKYHYTDVIDQEMVNRGETSHAKLLQWVKPGTVVLECGCAYGMMTRYMKEVLGCRVVILELEQEAFQAAREYADGGYCVDLETNHWMESIPDNTFDYIIYADVLEHLRDPESVLRKMRRLLKEDGSVLISVPNVAHGDIIMNLLCDQFTYTSLGLLDNTHIHLFARKNLYDMVQAAGYYMAEEDCTMVPLFLSEQGAFLPEDKKWYLEEALSVHSTRNIYQYICRLTVKQVETICKIQYSMPSDVFSKIYYDDGTGFCEEHCFNIKAERQDGCYVYRVTLPAECTQIRYDPVEGRKCLIKKLKCRCGDVELPIEATNGIGLDGSYLFANEDPQIVYSLVAHTVREITLEVDLYPLSCESWRLVEQFLADQCAHFSSVLQDKEQQLQAQLRTMEEVMQAQVRTMEEAMQAQLRAKEEAMQAQLRAKEEAMEKLEQEHQTSEHLRLAAEQEKESLKKKVCDQDQTIERLSGNLSAMESSMFWKITKPFRKLEAVFRHK